MQRNYVAVPADPREGRDVLDVLPASSSDEAAPGFFRSHWRRIPSLLWLWLALPLFFLPWIDVRCNNEQVLTQSGLQTCSGDYTAFGKWDTREYRASGSASSTAEQQVVESSPLSKIYFVCLVVSVLLGAAISLAVIIFQLSVRWPLATVAGRVSSFAITSGHFLVLALGSLCFGTLFCQIITGFPAERAFKEKSKNASTSASPIEGLDDEDETADIMRALMQVEVRHTIWVPVSLIITLVSPLMLLFESVITGLSVLLRQPRPPDVILGVLATD